MLYGFGRAADVGLQLLSQRFQNASSTEPQGFDSPLLREDGTFDYISADPLSNELALVHEGPSSLARIALGQSPTGLASFIRGANSWLVLSVRVSEGALQTKPWLRVDGDGIVHTLGAELAGMEFPSGGAVADDWVPFREHESYATTGWLNADTGVVKRVPPPPDGMQTLGLYSCAASPQLREDGRVMMGLRDDRLGGIFVEDGDGAFTRVGMPVRDGLYEFGHVGETLKLSAVSAYDRYCSPLVWETPEPAEPLLHGGQTQLLRAGRSLVIDDRSHRGVQLDPSGRYAAVSRDAGLVLHDLELGTMLTLPEGAHLVGWLGSDREPSAD